MRQSKSLTQVVGWTLATAVVGGAVFGGSAAATAAPAAQAPAATASAVSDLAPVVTHTGTGPTGYEVTFRHYAPDATSVQIRGEWGLRSVADPTTRPPSQYQRGDFFNEALINEMTLDASTGVWTFTTPLPPGTWSYQFQATPGADPLIPFTQDPANPSFNQNGDTYEGSYEPLSQVYVPQDPAFSDDDKSVQAPASEGQRGSIVSIRYDSPGAVACATVALCSSPEGQHDITVYTPAGYDPDRAVPYPTLYLSHGGGGNEIDWPTQGASANIIDNLIADKTMQPTVVVTTDFNGLLTIDGVAEEGYSQDLINNVIPLVEAEYNVSTAVNDRAFGGLSAGGGRAGNLLFEHPDTFGYYGIWSSTGAFGPTVDFSSPNARTRLALHVGIGIQDPGPLRHEGLDRLAATDIPFTRNDVNGVHSWDVWRQLLAIYAADIAFAHTSTDVGITNKAITATVTASTTETATPTGTVQFALNGKPLGKPVAVKDGRATVTIPTILQRFVKPATNAAPAHIAGNTVTVTYSGDKFYNTSTWTYPAE